MKKTEAIRWETLEGEGQESSIKHFNPRQSTRRRAHTCSSLHWPSYSPPPAEINMGSRGCLHAAEARVGSGAPTRAFH